MNYFGDLASKLTQLIFPNPEQGFTATVREYRDEVGKIIKVAVDIMPVVATVVGGPVVGGITAVATGGGKAARAVYDYLTTPVSKEKIQKMQISPEHKAAAQTGTLLISTVRQFVKEQVTETAGGSAALEETALGLEVATKGVKGKKEKVVQTVAVEALKQVVPTVAERILPEVAITLYEAGKPPLSASLRLYDMFQQVSKLTTAVKEFLNVRKLNQAAIAAIDLIQSEAAKKPTLRKGEISPKKAIRRIMEHKTEAKAARKEAPKAHRQPSARHATKSRHPKRG